jgi:hypothetical protein
MAQMGKPISTADHRKGPASDSAPLAFPAAIRIRAPRCRSSVRNAGEARDMIAKELPLELRRLPRWTFALALLEEAIRTHRKKALVTAERQFRQACSNEGWLADDSR